MTTRRWHFLAVVAIMAMAGCGGQGDAAAPSPSGSELADRTFVSADDPGARLVAGTRVRLTFRPGTLAAEGGCNHLTGKLAVEGDRLVVTDVGGTLMACSPELMEQDAWLTAFLQARPHWEFDAGTLVLSTGTDRLRLVDVRSAEPDQPLSGPRWSLESLLEGSAASSLPAGADVHLTFRDGRVTGATGCTEFSGAASVGEDAISFSPLTTRARKCAQPLHALDEAVRSRLADQVSYRITGDTLVLTGADGRGMELRAAS
ncbi:META domain-containing protein [Actinoplanes sp. NPDC049681]|uniref:META domain-containing protein n=1 Tax=Actinoplanes sp. NPDC049681 TaxID=3363905 RepID=UPI0037B1A987